MSRTAFMTIIILLHATVCCSQPADPATARPLPVNGQPRFYPAAGEWLAAQFLPIVYDRYIADKEYARISFRSVGDHLSPSSWKWDNDGFQTNQIGHPYHGSIFFNTFSSNGYSFGQSALATLAGSYVWEVAAENQAPAPNDLINTTFGGIVLGETTHRLAGRLRQPRSAGLSRQVNEVLALLIDPAGGFSRLIDGSWAHRYPPQLATDTVPVTLSLDGGLRKYNINDQDPWRNGRLGWYGRIHFEFGSPSINRKTTFSHISILVEGGKDDSSRINIVSVYGSLYGWQVRPFGIQTDCSISANYEYINNQAFFFSGQSVRANLYKSFRLAPTVELNTTVAAGPILLAAVPDHYLYENRDYDYGPGFAFNASANLQLGHLLSYRFAIRGAWMKTVSGNRSDYFLHAFTNELGLRIISNLSLTAEEGYFSLHGYYSKFPNVNKVYPYLRLALRYKLTF